MAAMEQPGCLHAGMDVYKWATKLGPAVPGDLLLDCFELARDIRTLDMQASPYDVTTYGLDPVAIETPEGKAEYVARQRGFAERGNALRERLVDVCERCCAPPTNRGSVAARRRCVTPPSGPPSVRLDVDDGRTRTERDSPGVRPISFTSRPNSNRSPVSSLTEKLPSPSWVA